MLSQDELRRLNAIERQLQASDPDFVHLLTRWPTPARGRWAMAAAVLTAVAGTLGIIVGLLAFSPALVVPSGFVTLAGWTWVFRRARRARPGDQPTGAG